MKLKTIKNIFTSFKKTYLTVGYDILQFIIFQAIMILLFVSLSGAFPGEEFMPTAGTIQSYMEQGITQDLKESTTQIKMFIIKIFLFIAIAIILNFIISSFFKSRVYNKIKQKKYSFAYFKKFLIINSSWLFCWLIIFYYSIKIIKNNAIVPIIIIELLIFIHSTVILRYCINTKDKYKNILNNTFNISIMKSYKFLIPVIIITIIFILNFSLTFYIIPAMILKITPESLSTIISLILATFAFITIFILMSFSRLYYMNTIKSIK
ncbi:hypothetical protein HN415_06625 [Candidatus Woesearchaeota archaeon]|jgi:hypothetical protein|nr:hypothetical protein [Candidatus Woesearchaeota archaeon]